MIRIGSYLFFLCFILPATLLAQDWSVKHYNTDEGLPGNITYQVIQDLDGNIWACTNGGICRFDSKEFKTFSNPLIKNNEILKCKIIGDKVWFLSFAGELFYIKDGETHQFDPDGALTNKMVLDFIEDDFGNLLIVVNILHSEDILFVFDEFGAIQSKVYHEFLIDGFPREGEFLFIKEGKLLISDKFDIFEFQYTSNSIQKVPILPFCHPTRPKVAYFFRDSKSRVWGYGKHHLILFDSAYNFVADMTHLVNSYKVNEIQEDREGNIWISTNGDGLIVIYNSPFIQYTTHNSSLPNNYIYDLDGDEEANVFIASHAGWLTMLHGKEWVNNIKISDSKAEIYDVLVSSQDEIMVSLEGLYLYEKSLNGIKLKAGGEVGNFKRLAENQNKDLLFVDPEGFWVLNDTHMNQHYGSEYNDIRAYCGLVNTHGVAILGTNQGIYSTTSLNTSAKAPSPIEKSFFKNLLETRGIVPFFSGIDVKVKKHFFNDSLSIDYYIADIQLANDGTIWIASRHNGLYQIKNNAIVHHYQEGESSLSSNSCNRLFIDNKNQVWLATMRGLNRINPRDKKVRKIGTDDGLTSNHVTSVYVHDAQVYVGTAKGLTLFDEKDIKGTQPAPPVVIRDIRINEKDTILHKDYNLDWDQNSFYIGFIAPYFQGKIRYSYRLKGAFDHWISTEDNYARFPDLNPGSYTFEVKSISKDGRESLATAQFMIRIKPHPLRSPLAYLLYSIFSLGLLLLAYFLRIRQIKRQEKEKTRINKKFAELELQALQAQMNPHFVFNAMNAIQNYIARQNVDQANKYLAEFGKLMRLFLESTRKKYIYMDEEIELLQLYIRLEKLRFRDRFEVYFQIDENLESEVEIPSMILQPFVENAINHGLGHKKGTGTLKISMNQQENDIKITIEDDGIGRKKANAIKQKSFKPYESHGMKIVEERLATLDFIDGYAVKVNIEDLVDDTGTKVEILIPIMD